MKKLILLVFAFSLVGCSLDDDGSNRLLEYAEITDVDLPEEIERGKNYDITFTYLMPSACHSFAGIDSGQEQTEEGSEVFFGVVTSYDGNLEVCDEDDTNLEREYTMENVTFSGQVGSIYTFKMWIGETAGESEYLTIQVPVVDPDDEGDDEDDEDDENGDDENDDSNE